jgi:primosomal protein N''
LEIAARERAEKKQQEFEERLRTMAEQMERRDAELNVAQEMIRRLEEQLKQLRAAKEELENRQTVSFCYNLSIISCMIIVIDEYY